ncbi:MAG: hypothetical protein IKK45_05625 [Akkermansia sp.]|nr:hypothetical protein [Akkermansia sp.]
MKQKKKLLPKTHPPAGITPNDAEINQQEETTTEAAEKKARKIKKRLASACGFR